MKRFQKNGWNKFGDTISWRGTRNRGFTLIELLVVIAIIGILSSVVLASLNTARGKGANAAVKSNLANVRAMAEIYYDANTNSYGTFAFGTCPTTAAAGNVFATTTVVNQIASAKSAGGGTAQCWSDNNNWSATVQLKVTEGSNGWWCVDSSGASKGVSAAPTTGAICP